MRHTSESLAGAQREEADGPIHGELRWWRCLTFGGSQREISRSGFRPNNSTWARRTFSSRGRETQAGCDAHSLHPERVAPHMDSGISFALTSVKRLGLEFT